MNITKLLNLMIHALHAAGLAVVCEMRIEAQNAEIQFCAERVAEIRAERASSGSSAPSMKIAAEITRYLKRSDRAHRALMELDSGALSAEPQSFAAQMFARGAVLGGIHAENAESFLAHWALATTEALAGARILDWLTPRAKPGSAATTEALAGAS